MLLTYLDLIDLVDAGAITAPEGIKHDDINGASIDVHLGDTLLVEDSQAFKWCDLAEKQTPPMHELELLNGKFSLYPGDFALASTREMFHLPNDIAIEFKLKSSAARAGQNHALAGWGDPGWNGSVLTLELTNSLRHTILLLTPGMPIGQVVFWRGRPVPKDRSYATRGQYNQDSTVQPSKGLR